MNNTKSVIATAIMMLLVAGCSGGSVGNGGSGTTSTSGSAANNSCPETGPYACKTGATEPLYAYQWHLNQPKSFFAAFVDFVTGSGDGNGVADGQTDLDVEPVHAAGIKGAGVNVLVLDDGVDAHHEDLSVSSAMSYNFEDGTSDPTPSAATGPNDAHGTNAAGIIAALQNGIGVMGIAPRVNLGGARYVFTGFTPSAAQTSAALGGASWSQNVDVINASFGSDPETPPSFDDGATSAFITSLSALPNLRNGKGLIYVMAAGNSYQEVGTRNCLGASNNGSTVQISSCANPVDDTATLMPMTITVAAASAKGKHASYSVAGPVNWVTGLGGEGNALGKFGEVGPYLNPNTGVPENGPQDFSTDLSGCARGYSRTGLTDAIDFLTPGTATNTQYNANCNYSVMNGTSAATPTVTGVVALMLAANPKLTWRDVREILRATSRQIDPNYGTQANRNDQVNLQNTAGQAPALTSDTSATLTDGATSAPVEFGWQTNAAGFKYSAWYGFGLVDAAKAVAMAKTYTAYKATAYNPPPFTSISTSEAVPYGAVKLLASIPVSTAGSVDEFQIRLNSPSSDLCIGSVGFYVQSPAGTISALSVPYNIFYKAANNGGTDVLLNASANYAQGSFAFYGEPAAGTWKIYSVAGVPETTCSTASSGDVALEYRILSAQ